MAEYQVAGTVDSKGESCPMPIVEAREAVEEAEVGDVLEVLSTDRGSQSDFQGWSDGSEDVELLDSQEFEEDGETVYRYYIEKV